MIQTGDTFPITYGIDICGMPFLIFAPNSLIVWMEDHIGTGILEEEYFPNILTQPDGGVYSAQLEVCDADPKLVVTNENYYFKATNVRPLLKAV